MSFLRIERKKSGTYLRIMESYRDASGKSKHRIIHSLGKAEDYSDEQLRRIGIRFFELGGGEVKSLLQGDLEELGRFNYGYQQIYGRALSHFRLYDVFRRIERKSRFTYSLQDVMTLMLLERLQTPCSKLKNFEHQNEYLNLPKVELHHIYRALDTLAKHNKLIQQQIYQTGRDLFNSKVDVVFYDVTTFYFDSQVEQDEGLRQKGFGKDGKTGKTQVLFSMMIDADKNPIGYRVFEGNTYEGHTFEHAIHSLQEEFNIDKVIIVADRGMLSRANIAKVVNHQFEYIIGERLRSLPKTVQESLLDKDNYEHDWHYADHNENPIHIRYRLIQHADKTVICTYSDKRARKDQHERNKRIDKANKLLKNPSALQNKSRRYYIKHEGDNAYQLDQDRIDNDAKYDGLLAISTNTTLPATVVLEQYKQLYKIEQCFRTMKSHLELRPMYHWTNTRIQGHICMCYIAFTLQNWVLSKVNKKKTVLTEDSLRDILNHMQVSLIQHSEEQLYIRSKPQPKERQLQNALGVKPLMPMTAKNRLVI